MNSTHTFSHTLKHALATLVVVACCLLTTASCGAGPAGGEHSQGDTIALSYARNLVMVDHGDHIEVTMLDPWHAGRTLARYTLTTDSTLRGEGVVHVPLKRAAVFTSVHCALLNELGAASAVRGVCDLQYMPLAYVREAVAQGRMTDLGNSMEPNMERLIDLMPDAVLRSPMEQTGGYGKLGRLDIPVLECADYMEVSPLARAEWIKLYGRLVGQAQRADSLFQCVEQRYVSLKQQAAQATSHPSLICEAPYNGQWYLPAGGSTMGQMYADAGARYLFADLEGTGASPISIEHVLERALTADVWLIKQYGLQSKAQLAADVPALRGIKAQAWTCDPSTSGFYEETPFHPDLLLADLVALLHPELNVHPAKRYFHRIP